MSTLNDYDTGAAVEPTPGRRIDDITGAWLDGASRQRSAVMAAFPALGEAIDRGDGLTKIISVWRCGTGGNYSPIADHFPALFEAMCREDDSGRAEPYRPAPETITAPALVRPAALDDILAEWHASSASQRDTVRQQFPELAVRLDNGNAARLADIVKAWKRGGRQPARDEITTAIPTLAAALRKAAEQTPAPGPAPETIATPAPSGEFRGLSHVVEVWRRGHRENRNYVAQAWPRLGEILDRADEYMREIEQRPAINECTPAPADDREPAHTIEVLDDMLKIATGQYQQSPTDMFGPGDWLNVAAYFAADAVTEKTALTEANGVGAAALIARNNCAAAAALADMFAHLAVAACAVEGVRRGR